MEYAQRIFKNVAENIVNHNINKDALQIYSTTGLSFASCQKVSQHINQSSTKIRDLLSNSINADDFIDMFLSVSSDLTEMQTSRSFSGNYRSLLLAWISGIDIRQLMSQYANTSEEYEELGRLIDDQFKYKFPWGVSAYIRIAKHVLGIEASDISNIIKFLPSMIKFGLPDPYSCWVMSVGIPSRRIAIQIAAAFRQEEDHLSYENFLDWLSRISSDRLQYEFQLKGMILEDVAKSIFLANTNQLLRRFTSFDELLSKEVEVRGIQYGARSIVALSAAVGQDVTLERDYDNLLDRNAILVSYLDKEMGFVPRELAQILSPDMDTGSEFKAHITFFTRDTIPRVRIKIRLSQ